MVTSVLVVDDHKLFREGLCSLLRDEPEIGVVGQADTGRQGVQMARDLAPDVVVMDITMHDLNGIEAARQIRSELPRARVVFLSAHSDSQYVTQAVDAGAAGYVLKDAGIEEVVRAIRAAAAHQTYLSPAVTAAVMQACRSQSKGGGTGPFTSLTARQREVLQLVAEGWTTKQIALHLHVSGKTVETHRQMVMDKLGIHSVAALTKFAVRQGLTALEK